MPKNLHTLQSNSNFADENESLGLRPPNPPKWDLQSVKSLLPSFRMGWGRPSQQLIFIFT